ncbi:MAG TPA: BMP family ABC transporter substrate-binding protein [Thermoleophilaceae bacterium]|nr:BMP family ABC transporter substrate-binding protein [Thermoleophilaceae bacterium]
MGARRITAAAAVAVLTIGVAACGSGGSSGGSSKSSEIKVGAALIGPKNDKSFDQAAYEGIQAAQQQFPQLKLTSALENRATDAERSDAVQTLAPVNKMVVTVSSSFGPVLDALADKFPNTYFLDVSGYTKTFHKNVTGFANDWGAMLYVAGVISAHLTKTNTVGYVGGAEIPPTIQGMAGFKAGALSVNPKIKVLTNLVGDFNDVAKAKSATSAMISDGADAIFPFINGGLPGVYAAGRESGKNPALFSEVIPDCNGYSNMVGTNFVDSKAMVKRLLTDYVHGQLKPGTTFLALQEPKLQTLQLCPKYQHNAEIARITKQTIADINSGKIKLPAAAVNPRPNYPYREGFSGPVKGSAG